MLQVFNQYRWGYHNIQPLWLADVLERAIEIRLKFPLMWTGNDDDHMDGKRDFPFSWWASYILGVNVATLPMAITGKDFSVRLSWLFNFWFFNYRDHRSMILKFLDSCFSRNISLIALFAAPHINWVKKGIVHVV